MRQHKISNTAVIGTFNHGDLTVESQYVYFGTHFCVVLVICSGTLLSRLSIEMDVYELVGGNESLLFIQTRSDFLFVLFVFEHF